MKLFLHIGTEKTGTTALQTWCSDNADALAAQKVWVCRSLESPNNFGAVVLGAGLNAGGDLLDAIGLQTEQDLEAFQAKTKEAFRIEIELAKQQGCDVFFVSSEHLHSRLTKLADIRRLSHFLGAYFSDIRATIFLRPQADLARSVQSNYVRWGIPVSRKTLLGIAKGHYFDYWSLYRLWRDGFPIALEVVSYKSNPNIIEWFARQFNLSQENFHQSDRRIKESVSLQSAAFMNALSVGLEVGAKHTELREKIIAATAGGGPLTFNQSDCARIARRFRRGNKLLCRAVDGIALEDLQADPAYFPEKGNIETLAQFDLSDGLRTLMERMK